MSGGERRYEWGYVRREEVSGGMRRIWYQKRYDRVQEGNNERVNLWTHRGWIYLGDSDGRACKERFLCCVP